MITDKMTIAEIHRHWENDKRMLMPKLLDMNRSWQKQCKKNPPKANFSRISDLVSRTTKQAYYLLFIHDGVLEEDTIHTLAKVQVGNGFNYYELVTSQIGEDVIVYTSHFLDRYQERMKVVGDRKHILLRLRRNNHGYHRIHHRNNRVVYAMKDGIALAIASPQRTTFVTFVSYDMLHPSQRASFNRVRDVLTNEKRIIKDRRAEGYSDQSIIEMLQLANITIFDDAEALYDLFFQDKIPTDMTESVQLGEGETYVAPEFENELNKFRV